MMLRELKKIIDIHFWAISRLFLRAESWSIDVLIHVDRL